jgi:hypothetical protein
MCRYVLEDVLQCEIGDDLLILVSPLHVNDYASFRSVADIAPPLPLQAGHRGVPFVQIKASVIQNSRRDDLMNGILMPDIVEHLLFGNGNGALGFSYPSTDVAMEMLWKELYLHPATINVWGTKPAKRQFMTF